MFLTVFSAIFNC